MFIVRWLRKACRRWAVGRSSDTRRLRRPRLEMLENRSVLAGGWVAYHDQPLLAGDSLNPTSPTTGDVVSFTLLDDTHTDLSTWPHLEFDLLNKVVDVVYSPEEWGWAGDWIQGVYGQLEPLDEGAWTLRGPQSTQTFVVQPGLPSPSLSIGNVVATEGQTGGTNFAFTVSLSAPSDQAVTVNFTTADGSATAGDSDYMPVSGVLTLAPGETVKSITVSVAGDVRDEVEEYFYVNLSNPDHATLAAGQGLARILNDDVPPALSIADATVVEGNLGTATAVFTVSLSAVSGRTVWFHFATADATAKAVTSDFVPATGALALAPGELTTTIAVQVQGDTRDEFNESFLVNLSGPINATLADSQGRGTIQDDDSPPALAIGDVTRAEGKSGRAYFVFTVTLSAASDQSVSVGYATANGTAKTSDDDYVAAAGTLAFAPGELSKTISIAVKGDKKKEAVETFFVNLSGAVNGLLADAQGLGTIVNDD